MSIRTKNIFRMFIVPILMLLVIFTSPSWALNGPSHNAINEYIVKNIFTFVPGNVFSLDDYLKTQLGMQGGVNTTFNSIKIVDVVKNGGTSEDNSWRFLNHFYNPLNKQGYSYGPVNLFICLFGYSPKPATDWMLMPKGTQNMDGNYSWNDARRYYYQALTSDKTIRETNFATSFTLTEVRS